jgi:hypothetical protein
METSLKKRVKGKEEWEMTVGNKWFLLRGLTLW